MSANLPGMVTRKNYQRLLHVGSWTVFLILSVFIFSNFWPLNIAILKAVSNGSLFILVFYLNLSVLIPYFYTKKRYVLYIMASIGLFGVFTSLRIFFREYFFGLPSVVGMPERPLQSEFLIVSSFLFVFGISIFVKLIQNHVDSVERNREIIRQRDEAEFRMLKAQVNPHFLFNTLNNLYTLAYTGSEKTPGAIMSLSEIMRYLIYEAGAQLVPLEKEIRFLTNYVELEKLRIEDTSKVTFRIDQPSENSMIAPLVFIAFVENAFKHSNIDTDPEGFVQIFLSFGESEIYFTCENSMPTSTIPKKEGGTGLANARARLDLMYPGKAALRINSTNLVYSVTLKISI